MLSVWEEEKKEGGGGGVRQSCTFRVALSAVRASVRFFRPRGGTKEIFAAKLVSRKSWPELPELTAAWCLLSAAATDSCPPPPPPHLSFCTPPPLALGKFKKIPKQVVKIQRMWFGARFASVRCNALRFAWLVFFFRFQFQSQFRFQFLGIAHCLANRRMGGRTDECAYEQCVLVCVFGSPMWLPLAWFHLLCASVACLLCSHCKLWFNQQHLLYSKFSLLPFQLYIVPCRQSDRHLPTCTWSVHPVRFF